ncbi:hypothetical protein [Actinophytocola gossypii]|uniref:DUF4350 domain-containing protein n=1 Tax=Actinophytocola gossypii TaxID=2812003 RepID=A0ABT2J969_9PSEU|nr:hypothetical protein [Actinophytocola gossypii]MCT2584412.1 hypothetical protein [Actinophytocola gossypii]
MRVVRVLGVVWGAVGVLGGVAPAAHADEELPPKLDVDAAIEALADTDIHRAPGAVAYLDEDVVREALPDGVKVLVAPYMGPIEPGANYADGDAHLAEVYQPLDDWATENDVGLVVVEGIYVSVYGERGAGIGPTDLPSLRQTTAYLDVTSPVVYGAKFAGGDDDPEDTVPPTDTVEPSEEQVDEVVAALRDERVYNAPGREDTIDPVVTDLADEFGISVRVAAFPVVEPGERVVDYAPALARAFPDDLILVTTGRWLDVAGAERDKAVSARDYAFGRFQIGSFRQGSSMNDRIGTVLERLDTLLEETAFGRPQPAPQPPVPEFDVRQTVGAIGPWVLVGSAAVLGAGGVLGYRRRAARRERAEELALHRAGAAAMARIGQLGARLLAAGERGEDVDPAAAERHATARSLYDRAHTAAAMAEVIKIADEGVRLS